MIRGRGSKVSDELAHLVSDTQDLLAEVLRENRSLRARNAKLAREVDRLSQGWEQIKRLARQAPKARARRGRG